MSLESDTTTVRHGGARTAGRAASDVPASPLLPAVMERLSHGAPRIIALAPGRLNVLGGVAEYSGAVVLHTPIGRHACVGLQRHESEELLVHEVRQGSHDGAMPTTLRLSDLSKDDTKAGERDASGPAIAGTNAVLPRCVVGAVAEMLRAGLLSLGKGGLSVSVGSTFGGLVDAGRHAAVAAATMVAVAEAYGIRPAAHELSTLCQQVENRWLEAPVGIGDAACSLLGEPRTLSYVRCDPFHLAGSIRLPHDVVLLGVDCGAVRPDALERFRKARTATFMGRALIDRIIRFEDGEKTDWAGYLAHVPVAEYVERFRHRVPTRLKGREFIERFGETVDPLTHIDPNLVYKVRSRTEHHIYEQARACQFIECLSRALNDGDDGALREAGELMYASHWSYGQRCGLGSVETDVLVGSLRQKGADADILGANITGRGSGGVVAVLMRGTDRARQALDSVLEEYRSHTGNTVTLLEDALPGALETGARRM